MNWGHTTLTLTPYAQELSIPIEWMFWEEGTFGIIWLAAHRSVEMELMMKWVTFVLICVPKPHLGSMDNQLIRMVER